MDLIFSVEGLAIVVPLLIFIIAIVLLVKRLASFILTCVLLAFALVSGLAIVNYKAVGDWIRGDSNSQRVEELKDAMGDFRDQLLKAFDELKERMIEEKQQQQNDKQQQQSEKKQAEQQKQTMLEKLNTLELQFKQRQEELQSVKNNPGVSPAKATANAQPAPHQNSSKPRTSHM